MSDADVQEVLCPNPSCGKKYRLKGKVPATFTCTKCSQAMDLSAFAAPEAPASPAPRGAARAGGRASRAGGAGASRGAAPAGRRARDEDDADEGRARFQPPPKNNNALIFGSLGALVLVVLVLVLVMRKKDPPGPAPSPAGASAVAPAAPAAAPDMASLPAAALTPVAPALAPVAPAAVATPPAGPARSAAPAAEPAPPAAPEPRRGGGGGLASLQSWTAPAELQLSAEEKEKIERAVELAIHGAGRDMREAQDQLVALDRKAIWRLVSEFKTIQDSRGFEDRQGLIKASIVDRVLRKIDGYMERKCGVREQIKAESSPDWALNVAKRWNGWLERGLWKTRLAPWDPRVDEADEAADKGSGR